MTNKLAAKFATALSEKERGASALEYIGMVIVAAFIVGVVYAAMKGAGLDTAVTEAVNKILGK